MDEEEIRKMYKIYRQIKMLYGVLFVLVGIFIAAVYHMNDGALLVQSIVASTLVIAVGGILVHKSHEKVERKVNEI